MLWVWFKYAAELINFSGSTLYRNCQLKLSNLHKSKYSARRLIWSLWANIKEMTLTELSNIFEYCLVIMGLVLNDYNKSLILLSVIQLSGWQCTFAVENSFAGSLSISTIRWQPPVLVTRYVGHTASLIGRGVVRVVATWRKNFFFSFQNDHFPPSNLVLQFFAGLSLSFFW